MDIADNEFPDLPECLDDYLLSPHARQEMLRRGISAAEVASVLGRPEQTMWVRRGRAVFQSRTQTPGSDKEYLLRVFIDLDRQPAVVVTVYRTSKIAKYWRPSSK